MNSRKQIDILSGEIQRLNAVAGSLVYALNAIQRMDASHQFYDKGGPAMVKAALEVARNAEIEIGRNPLDVVREGV